MNAIPDSDKKLIADLQGLIDQVESLKRGLYRRRAGCACTETQLCGLHAGVWNHLDEAENSLALAIHATRAE